MAALRFDFEPPEHGWMPVTLGGNDQSWRVVASCIFDFVTELAGAALELAEDRPVREVIFFEEPEANVLTFAPRGAEIELTVTWYFQESRRAGARQCFLALAPREAVVWAIWSGLRRLEGSLGRAALEAAWTRTFPAREVEQLGDYVRCHRQRAQHLRPT